MLLHLLKYNDSLFLLIFQCLNETWKRVNIERIMQIHEINNWKYIEAFNTIRADVVNVFFKL